MIFERVRVLLFMRRDSSKDVITKIFNLPTSVDVSMIKDWPDNKKGIASNFRRKDNELFCDIYFNKSFRICDSTNTASLIYKPLEVKMVQDVRYIKDLEIVGICLSRGDYQSKLTGNLIGRRVVDEIN